LAGQVLLVRFPDGWTGIDWASPRGTGGVAHPGMLPRGPHPYEVAFSDTDPRMYVRARGTAWIEPATAAVLWVDAAAIVQAGPLAYAEAADPAANAEAVAALKRLAAGRRMVYLVATEARDYAAMRRRLATGGAPAGPALWLPPGSERTILPALIREWPPVSAAVVCSPALAAAADGVKVRVWRVAPADGSVIGSGGTVSDWSQVVRDLAPQR